MKKAVHRGRVRLQAYIDPALAERVERFCATTCVTESAVVKSSLDQYLDGTTDATLVLRRLDRLSRSAARTQRDLELLSEAFGIFVRIWFAHVTTIPEEDKRAARKEAESRYRQFVEHIGEQFFGGHRFLDDLPHECVANDAELDGIITTSDLVEKPAEG
jgi:hypothetical protein